MEIYVGNLAWSASEQELADSFGEYGTVEKATIIVDRDSGRSRGFGFVTMADRKDAAKARVEEVNKLNRKVVRVLSRRGREAALERGVSMVAAARPFKRCKEGSTDQCQTHAFTIWRTKRTHSQLQPPKA